MILTIPKLMKMEISAEEKFLQLMAFWEEDCHAFGFGTDKYFSYKTLLSMGKEIIPLLENWITEAEINHRCVFSTPETLLYNLKKI